MRLYKIISTLSAVIFLMGGCSGESDSGEQDSMQNDMSGSDHAAHAEMEMGSGEHTDESLYNVSSHWKNRYGQEVQLGDLSGKVQVLAMVYTHCEFACPRILADMKRISDNLSADELDSTHFLIVSIDPKRDTPERLNNFADENNLDDTQWTLLNGSQGDVLELAALLGVKYKKISETDFTHSNMITVLNNEGEIAHQREKLGDQPTTIVEEIKKLAM